MRIGINLLYFLPGDVAGAETYIRNLLSGLARVDSANQYFLFTNRDNHDTFHLADRRFKRVRCSVAARPQIRRVAFEQLILPRLASYYRLDVLHSPAYTAPLFTPCANVVSILDMLYRVYPGIIPQPKRLFWQIFVPLSARRCHVVLTISDNSRRDIINYLRIPADKVVVSHLAMDERLVERHRALQSIEAQSRACYKPTSKGPYVFTLANTFKDHKNILGLLTAFKMLRSRLPEINLVVGGKSGLEPETRQAIKEHDLIGSVLLPGYLSLDEMVWLYNNAAAYVIPSLFEGFGLPALEAMYFGVPVASSNAGSLPEVVGDAGVLFDPKDTADMAESLYRVLTDKLLRADLILRGRRRVSQFSWNHAALKTLAGYELAVNRKRRSVKQEKQLETKE
jgi:glycosyltransferase involved in cell wall biosynthesis